MTADLAPHRPLVCVTCGGLVLVLEIGGSVDPDRYRCLPCLEERAAVRRERAEQRPAVAYGVIPF